MLLLLLLLMMMMLTVTVDDGQVGMMVSVVARLRRKSTQVKCIHTALRYVKSNVIDNKKLSCCRENERRRLLFRLCYTKAVY